MFCYLRKKGMDIYLTVIVINIEKKKELLELYVFKKTILYFQSGM